MAPNHAVSLCAVNFSNGSGLVLPVRLAHRPHTRAFCGYLGGMPQIRDCVAERGEFELPVPICEQSDDSISFATSRRTAKRFRPAAHF
jgi:hypothetical protein